MDIFKILQVTSDYWWVVPLAGIALLAYRYAGWRGLVAVATLGLAGGLWTAGRRHERQKVEQAAEARRLQAIKDRERVDKDVSYLSPDDRRKRLNPWMRDN